MVRIIVEIENELSVTKEFESEVCDELAMAINYCGKICSQGIFLTSCLEGDDTRKYIPPYRIKEIKFEE